MEAVQPHENPNADFLERTKREFLGARQGYGAFHRRAPILCIGIPRRRSFTS